MPSDAVTLAVTTGFGVSVVAGIVSGLCYILVHGYNAKKRRNRDSVSPWQCNLCGGQFRSIDGVLETSKVVTCSKCKQRVCRFRCSSRERLNEGWVCHLCQNSTDSWFKGILSAIQPNFKKGVHFRSKMNTDRIDEIDEDLEKLRKREKEQVRDFIERLVTAMLGGGLDDTCISKLYNDNHYDTMFAKYHAELSGALTDLGSALHISIANLPITGQSPCSAHATLKLLIQRIIQDALDLPKLKRAEQHPAIPEDEINNRTYEDLLSTAVLNKVIQSYQDEGASSSASVSSRASGRAPKDKEYFFGKETLDSKWRGGSSLPELETSSVSSVEDWVRSDSSLGSTKYVDHLSLTIKQRIEEFSPTEDSDPEDSEPPHIRTASLLSQDDWQDNWYLQKRAFAGAHSPVPVPMLVPLPNGEAKVLIGDKEAEDTSDLSDAASDYGDAEVAPGINSILVDSRTVIGGRNLISFEGAGTDEVDDGGGERGGGEGEAEEQELVDGGRSSDFHPLNGVEDNSPVSIESNTEKDTEYTEKYASLPRTIVKTPQIKPRNSIKSNETPKHVNGKIATSTPKSESSFKQNRKRDSSSLDVSSDDVDHEICSEGRYSRREKEKWKHPVSMKNNPYSKENIEKRISSRSSSLTSLFGRDYYIREASRPQGARKSNGYSNDSNVDEQQARPQSPQEQDIKDAEETEAVIVKAVPAVVEDHPEDTPVSQPDVPDPTQTPENTSNLLEISSDSDLSIERVYNPQTGKIIEKYGHQTQEIQNGHREDFKENKHEPEFLRSSSPVDENHNNLANSTKKREFLDSVENIGSPIKSAGFLTETAAYLTESRVDDIQEHLVPLQIQKYEQISENTIKDQLRQKPKPAVRSFKSKTVSDEPAKGMMVDNPQDVIEEDTNDRCESKTPDFSEEEILMDETPDISLEPSIRCESNVSQLSRTASSLGPDPEISDLKEKHLVKHILGEFSRSYPNLTKIPKKTEETRAKSAATNLSETEQETHETEGDEIIVRLPSVQDLKKKFEDNARITNIKNMKQQVYSLTARSIPRQFRQELKQQNEDLFKVASPEVNSTENGKPDLQSELTQEVAEVFPKAKCAIEYFENLSKGEKI